MQRLFLNIELLSPLCPAAGWGQPGEVDREVCLDELGFPTIPGRRLKGLLREGYVDLQATGVCPSDWPNVDELFGCAGDVRGASFTIGDARPYRVSDLGPWVRWLTSTGAPILAKREISNALTRIRHQTRIDRKTGAALDNTLRGVRLISPIPGFAMYLSALEFRGNPDESFVRALGAAAMAVQRIGSARNRGYGKVRSRLYAADRNICWSDKAIEAIKDGAGEPGETARSRADTGCQASSNQPPQQPEGCTHLLRYRLKLKASASFAVSGGDENLIATEKYVPATAIKGSIAWKLLDDGLISASEKCFRNWFVDGTLRFLNAYPIHWISYAHPTRALPLPTILRAVKGDDGILNLVATDDDSQAFSRLSGFGNVVGHTVYQCNDGFASISYHHARPELRRYQSPNEQSGRFYAREFLPAGREFEGAIFGGPKALEWLQNWSGKCLDLSVGGSRSAQYGGDAVLSWIDEPLSVADVSGEWDAWKSQNDDSPDLAEEATDNGIEVILVCLSELVVRNDLGHFVPSFPLEEINACLDGVASLTDFDVTAYARTKWTGGYQSHLRLPRARIPVVAAGSSFVLKFSKSSDRAKLADCLRELEQNGLGCRREDGFGRIAIRNLEDEMWRGQVDSDNSPRPDGDPPEQLLLLIQHTFEDRLLRWASQDAFDRAKSAEKVPSSSLLGRLRVALQRNELRNFIDWSNQLSEKAKLGLSECKLYIPPRTGHPEELNGSLFCVIEKVASPTNTAGRHEWPIVKLGCGVVSEGFQHEPGEVARFAMERLGNDLDAGNRVARHYLMELISTLMRVQRVAAYEGVEDAG